jgi:hypothetical protein
MFSTLFPLTLISIVVLIDKVECNLSLLVLIIWAISGGGNGVRGEIEVDEIMLDLRIDCYVRDRGYIIHIFKFKLIDVKLSLTLLNSIINYLIYFLVS